MGLALNSLNSVSMYALRTATVVGTMVKNGPITRANMRVRIRDCSGVVIALPPGRPGSVYRPVVGKLDQRWVRWRRRRQPPLGLFSGCFLGQYSAVAAPMNIS